MSAWSVQRAGIGLSTPGEMFNVRHSVCNAQGGGIVTVEAALGAGEHDKLVAALQDMARANLKNKVTPTTMMTIVSKRPLASFMVMSPKPRSGERGNGEIHRIKVIIDFAAWFTPFSNTNTHADTNRTQNAGAGFPALIMSAKYHGHIAAG